MLFHGVFNPSFHLSITVLVHYRSYLVFSLGLWSAQIQKGVCRLPAYLGILYSHRWFQIRDFHPLWSAIPRCSSTIDGLMLRSCNPGINSGLDSSLFARRLLRESLTISFPPPTEIFHFSGLPPLQKQGYLDITPGGFLHSDTAGSQLLSSSPTTFAAWCVLLRPDKPRHPLSALVHMILACM